MHNLELIQVRYLPKLVLTSRTATSLLVTVISATLKSIPANEGTSLVLGPKVPTVPRLTDNT